MDYDKISRNLPNRTNIKFGKSTSVTPTYVKGTPAYEQKKKDDAHFLFWYIFRIVGHFISKGFIVAGIIVSIFNLFLGLNIVSLGFFFAALHLLLPNRLGKYYCNTPISMMYMLFGSAALIVNIKTHIEILNSDFNLFYHNGIMITLSIMYLLLGLNMLYLGVWKNILRLFYKKVPAQIVDAAEVLALCPARVHYYMYNFNEQFYTGIDTYFEHWYPTGKNVNVFVNRFNPKKMLSPFSFFYTFGNTLCGIVFIFISIYTFAFSLNIQNLLNLFL